VIIVEGPDGAGKSTLVAQIRERFGIGEGVRGTSDRSLLYTVTVPDTFKALEGMITGDERPVVWDRLFYSEFVYHPLTGRHCQFSEGQRQHINEILMVVRPPIILCMPPTDVVYKNAGKDEQMDGVMDNLSRIYIAYNAMFRWMPAHTVIYDYTMEDNTRVMQIIESYLGRRSLREWSRTPAT